MMPMTMKKFAVPLPVSPSASALAAATLPWKNADRPMARPAKMPVNMASAGSAPAATALRMKFISRKP